jgi:hypothetical protein
VSEAYEPLDCSFFDWDDENREVSLFLFFFLAVPAAAFPCFALLATK